MAGRYWLNDQEVLRRVQAASVSPLVKCAALVEAEAKRLLSKGAGKQARPDTFRENAEPYSYTSSPPGSPPLVRSGNLRSSISYARTPEGTIVVGPTTVGWYGRVHEFGAMITVTAKMRAYLAAVFGWHLRRSTTQIHIPARPFMRPALSNCVRQFPEQFRNLPLGGTVK